MKETFNFLFQYLEKEQININKNEFQFQIQSHPDYPSLVSIIDTLSFFNIDNGALIIKIPDIELLPDCFLALLENENSKPQFYFVERKNNTYLLNEEKGKKVLSKDELELRWKEVVLLVEKPERGTFVQVNKRKWFWVLPSLCIGLLILTLFQLQISIAVYFFFIFPILGVLFSIAALKDLFGTKSELLNRFCNVTSSTGCTSVVDSKKWKIFEIINFSDLSVFFFGSQFLGLLLFLFMADAITYFSVQKIMLVCAVPVLLTSVYYQKYVEKKWCPICLVIISIVLLELSYILLLLQLPFDFQIHNLTVMGFVFVTVALGWVTLKNLLNQQKKLKEFQIKSSRFMRNYEIFKNNLLASDSIENIPLQLDETIILGNPEASLKITVVTNPFCGFCAGAHTIVEEILDRCFEKVCFNIHFNFNEANNDQKSKKIHQQLVSIYFNQGQQAFMKTLHDWFKDKDEKKLNILENPVVNEPEINQILAGQFNWNKLNHINYTPAIIINGYFLPKQYEKSDLIHFINDLSEDEDF